MRRCIYQIIPHLLMKSNYSEGVCSYHFLNLQQSAYFLVFVILRLCKGSLLWKPTIPCRACPEVMKGLRLARDDNPFTTLYKIIVTLRC
jgi:hypothetical protein